MIFGDKKMKECVECGKKLGFIEGYRHPTKGKDYLLCSNCFDVVTESVEKWREFILPYEDFFKKKSPSSWNIVYGTHEHIYSLTQLLKG